MPRIHSRLMFAASAASLICLLAIAPASAQIGPAPAQPAAAPAVDEDTKKVINQLITVSGALRTHVVRHDVYPAKLEELVEKGLLEQLEKDPWGNPLQYKLTERKVGENDPRVGRVRIIRPDGSEPENKPSTTKLWDFEILSAGPDGRYGTLDDIAKTRTSLRLNVSPEQRAEILKQGGNNYQVSLAAWSTEQAFRIWLLIAESEYKSGEQVKSIDELKLPEPIFANGQPVDAFGRYIELKSVRGLRSLYAEEVPDVAPSMVMTEADFVASLTDRMKNLSNHDYRVNQVFNEIRTFQMTRGRLPLTMNELTSSAANQWFNRARNGGSFHYITYNDDRTFVVMDLGTDALPGGREENADRVYYGPEDVSTASSGRGGGWSYNDSSSLFAGLKEAIAAAVAREADAGKSGDKGKANKPKEDKTAEDLATPVSDVPPVPQEMPPAPPEVPKEERDGVSAGGAVAGLITIGAIGGWLLAQDAGQPAPADDKLPLEPGAYKLMSKLDLIPKLLFDQAEATTLGIVSEQDWHLDQIHRRLSTLASRLNRYMSALGNTAPPCGNIDLSNGDAFREAGNQDWRSNSWWDEDYVEPTWVVARMEVGEFGVPKALVVVAVPKEPDQAIMVVYYEAGSEVGPLYARQSDQPKEWAKLVAACNGDPAVSPTGESKPSDADKPADQPTPGEKPGSEVEPVGEAKPQGEIRPVEVKPAGAKPE